MSAVDVTGKVRRTGAATDLGTYSGKNPAEIVANCLRAEIVANCLRDAGFEVSVDNASYVELHTGPHIVLGEYEVVFENPEGTTVVTVDVYT